MPPPRLVWRRRGEAIKNSESSKITIKSISNIKKSINQI
jgi:hypothetical protein